jgi:hypothetical protein
MKLISIQRGVMSGQCKNAPLRLQIRYTAVFLLPGLIPGWAGTKIGLFTPKKTEHGYRCTGFYFQPWLAPDVSVCQLPAWYRVPMRMMSFRLD